MYGLAGDVKAMHFLQLYYWFKLERRRALWRVMLGYTG
jgi:hypothetical protein